MTKLKTQKSQVSVEDFVAGVSDERKREDCRPVSLATGWRR